MGKNLLVRSMVGSLPTITNEEVRTQLTTMLLRPGFILLAAIWIGVVTGLGVACLLAGKRLLLHQMFLLSPHIVWMSPLADCLLFAAIGLPLLLVARHWPRFVSLRLVVFVFAVLWFLCLLELMVPRVHHYGKLLLATGLGMQTSRFVAAHEHVFYALVRRTTGWMIVVIVALAVAVTGWRERTERLALAKLPHPLSDTPNVLLITLDTVRAQN